MKEQEIRNLYEAYQQVYETPEVSEEKETVDEAMSSYDRNRKRAAQRAAERNAARDRGQTGNVPGVGYVSPRRERETYTDESGQERHKSGARMPKNEEVDLFDTILEYLVAEGYADTNENALVIMANMSEEWRQSIVEEQTRKIEVTPDNGKPYLRFATPKKIRELQSNPNIQVREPELKGV